MASIPILDLSKAIDPSERPELLVELHAALFEVGFLYIINHGVQESTICQLTDLLPRLFDLSDDKKAKLSKLNSPHFLGYSGFAEETTLGKQDLREQFDFATELPVVYNGDLSQEPANVDRKQHEKGRDFSKMYWRLRGPNQWPAETSLPGFRKAFTEYHDAVEELSYRFVHLIEEAFSIPVGTFDHFFGRNAILNNPQSAQTFLPPQHRIKLLRYPPAKPGQVDGQGVGAHKDSSGWLTFLYQVGNEPGLEVLSSTDEWLPVKPMPGSFVVNFGNAFEAATGGAVKATVHRVVAPGPESNVRYSIPFFQGLPLDMTVSEVKGYIPEAVQQMNSDRAASEKYVSPFLDPRWDSLGESQLRKWIKSHQNVAYRWYHKEVVEYYSQA